MRERAPAILLCAASGTGLSRVIGRLRTDGSTIIDFEDVLCNSYKGRHDLGLEGDETPNMEQLARRPRAELHKLWRTTIHSQVKILKSSRSTQARVMALHLTWHNSSTNEFFTPVDVEMLKPGGIDKVVVLIDDIYDMFSQLQKPDDLFSPDFLITTARLLAKFAFLDDFTPAQQELFDKQQKLAAIESAIDHLLLWRRLEMLQAEILAHALGAELTLLATKHSFASLESIVGLRETPRVYLSHRITEVRGMNKKLATLPFQLGAWAAIAPEVNRLHLAFANHAQVLINPTAIDELRFGGATSPSSYSPYLSARWPLPVPTNGLLPSLTSEGSEHTSFFLPDNLPAEDVVASSVVRALVNKIYFDIAHRDHYIVEHTPGLLVYRPFFCKDYSNPTEDTVWSGGVKPELQHWLTKAKEESTVKRRAGFIHTNVEIKGRLLWLKGETNYEKNFRTVVCSHLGTKLKDEDFPPEEIGNILAGRVVRPIASHLDQHPPWFLKQRAGSVIHWIESFGVAALYFVFTMQDRPPIEGDEPGSKFDVAILTLDEDIGRNVTGLDEIVIGLTDFFADNLKGVTLSRDFWSILESIFQEVFGMSISDAAFAAIGIHKDTLVRLRDGIDR